jgi:TolA-binding protein
MSEFKEKPKTKKDKEDLKKIEDLTAQIKHMQIEIEKLTADLMKRNVLIEKKLQKIRGDPAYEVSF